MRHTLTAQVLARAIKNLYPEEPELEREVILESLLCFKRAGADAIFSYFSERVAEWLKNPN